MGESLTDIRLAHSCPRECPLHPAQRLEHAGGHIAAERGGPAALCARPREGRRIAGRSRSVAAQQGVAAGRLRGRGTQCVGPGALRDPAPILRPRGASAKRSRLCLRSGDRHPRNHRHMAGGRCLDHVRAIGGAQSATVHEELGMRGLRRRGRARARPFHGEAHPSRQRGSGGLLVPRMRRPAHAHGATRCAHSSRRARCVGGAGERPRRAERGSAQRRGGSSARTYMYAIGGGCGAVRAGHAVFRDPALRPICGLTQSDAERLETGDGVVAAILTRSGDLVAPAAVRPRNTGSHRIHPKWIEWRGGIIGVVCCDCVDSNGCGVLRHLCWSGFGGKSGLLIF